MFGFELAKDAEAKLCFSRAHTANYHTTPRRLDVEFFEVCSVCYGQHIIVSNLFNNLLDSAQVVERVVDFGLIPVVAVNFLLFSALIFDQDWLLWLLGFFFALLLAIVLSDHEPYDILFVA